MTVDSSTLNQPTTYQGEERVTIGNGNTLPIHSTGTGILETPYQFLHLSHLLHAPQISHNLLSVHKLASDNNCILLFDSNGCVIKDKITKKVLLQGRCTEGLYRIPFTFVQLSSSSQALTATTRSSSIWHLRLGHPHNSTITTLAKQLSIPSPLHTSKFCQPCCLAKSHKLPFTSTEPSTHQPLELIHSDVWGPSPTSSPKGFRYYVLFIDDFTRFCWVYPLVAKSDVFPSFVHFKALVENQFSSLIKVFRSDGGGEFNGRNFQSLFSTSGIHHQLSSPHTPEQNGLAERKHRHLLEVVRSLLLHSSLPSSFWVEALLTATFLINRLPTPLLHYQSPYEKLFHRRPDYKFLRSFGCQCYPWLRPYTSNKFSPRSTPCIFIGYSPHHKAYRCYNPITGRVFISRHVVFDESCFSFSQARHNSSSQPSLLPYPFLVPSSLSSPSLNCASPSFSSPPPPAPLHECSPPSPSISPSVNPPLNSPPPPSPTLLLRKHPMITRFQTGSLKPKHILSLISAESAPTEPTCYTSASTDPQWRKAMSLEYNAL